MRPRTHTPTKAVAATTLALLCVLATTPSAASAATLPPSDTPATAGSVVSESVAATTLAAASDAVTAGRAAVQAATGKVDTTQLGIQIAQLDDAASQPEFMVAAFTGLLTQTTAEVSAAVAAYDAAQAQAAQKAAEALAQANTPAGARATASALAQSTYGWGSAQFSCLSSLWQKESGWNYRAYNSSGATGIPQALPGSKMAAFGTDWATNATTQIKWGLDYISRAYGTPCAAWSHSQS
ncbi:MAG: phospholipase, partial [Actinobacteria bacterium]|nr:phospholipase [Actinomycetota bacterium]